MTLVVLFPDFNSNMVRLKVIAPVRVIPGMEYFNSNMVRLKVCGLNIVHFV